MTKNFPFRIEDNVPKPEIIKKGARRVFDFQSLKPGQSLWAPISTKRMNGYVQYAKKRYKINLSIRSEAGPEGQVGCRVWRE